jgi:hypothetical protein
MPTGLQIFNSAGQISVDITSRLSGIYGNAKVDPTLPTNFVSLPTGGEAWYSFQPQEIWGFTTMNVLRPIFSISGTTLSWKWSASSGANPFWLVGIVFYGIY